MQTRNNYNQYKIKVFRAEGARKFLVFLAKIQFIIPPCTRISCTMYKVRLCTKFVNQLLVQNPENLRPFPTLQEHAAVVSRCPVPMGSLGARRSAQAKALCYSSTYRGM